MIDTYVAYTRAQVYHGAMLIAMLCHDDSVLFCFWRRTSTEDSKGLRTVDCRDSSCQRVAFILFCALDSFLHARSHFSNFYHGANILLTTELNSRNGSSLLLFLSDACDSTEELLSLSAMRTAISSMLGKKKIGL